MVIVAIRILEGLFAVGAVGSAIVIVLTTIDDMRLLFSRDDGKVAGAGVERTSAGPAQEMMKATLPARG
jgi:hypothetical protein